MPELVDAVDVHYRADTPERRIARVRAQSSALAQSRLRTHPELEPLAQSVVQGGHDAYTATELLLGNVTTPES